MDVRRLLDEAAQRHPDRTLLHCGGRRSSYAELAALQDRMARALRAAGAQPGDRVAAFFPNCHLFLAASYAALKSELALMPMNLRLAPAEREAVLERGGARFLLGTPALLPATDLVHADGWGLGRASRRDDLDGASAGPQEGFLLYFTSGTTGDPKGVVLTRGNLEAHAAMTLEALRFSDRDVWLHAAPMFHLADAWAIFTATAAGAAHAFLPRWDAREAVALVRDAGVTLTNLVPSMIPDFLDAAAAAPGATASLRLLMSGGSPIAPALVERIETTLGCEYLQTYGLTETSPFLTFSFLEDAERLAPGPERWRRLGRTGRAAPGIALRVVQPAASAAFDDVRADDTEVGEVVVRGASVTPGYWRDPEATSAAFLGGWFHTGDLGTIDAHGSVQLVDRAKDVIVTGGETVYSVEVERALLSHPAVREAAVFAVPDARYGEAVRAAVVLQPGTPAAEAAGLRDFCRGRMAGYKGPRTIDVVEALPRTGSGKVDKKRLREPFWRGRDRRIS
ncbi:MAG TPA: AMP-binding protein [Candidatus Polarisedimenticolia bacterium]|nr:AMP-binding protein [Candidatus Polarisedimenticolia bacterium]